MSSSRDSGGETHAASCHQPSSWFCGRNVAGGTSFRVLSRRASAPGSRASVRGQKGGKPWIAESFWLDFLQVLRPPSPARSALLPRARRPPPHQLSTTSRVLNSITRAADVAGADAIGDTGAGTSVSVVALAGDADTGGEPIGSAPCLSGPGQCLPRRQHRLARDSGLTDRQPFHLS